LILGLGIDVVELDRIEEAMKNPRFAQRILTEKERLTPMPAMRLAGRWAAKEAIAKAIPIKLSWHDVEIANDETGAPSVTVTNPKWDPNWRLMISISHERGIAAAVAILLAV